MDGNWKLNLCAEAYNCDIQYTLHIVRANKFVPCKLEKIECFCISILNNPLL